MATKSKFPGIYVGVLYLEKNKLREQEKDIPMVDFYEMCLFDKTLYSLEQYTQMFNDGEINHNDTFIRFFKVKF